VVPEDMRPSTVGQGDDQSALMEMEADMQETVRKVASTGYVRANFKVVTGKTSMPVAANMTHPVVEEKFAMAVGAETMVMASTPTMSVASSTTSASNAVTGNTASGNTSSGSAAIISSMSQAMVQSVKQNERISVARAKGYEGDACPECGHLTMLRNGTCLKCDTCGATTGCS